MHRVPNARFCLATGATPTQTYADLPQRIGGKGACNDVRVIKLDEWGGVPMTDSATCETYLRRHVLDPLAIAASNYVGFQSDAADPAAECARVRAALHDLGPPDLCVLGLGVNGHLGFNEPAPHLQPHAHVATLAPTTLQHAMWRARTPKPTYGLTLGMADILQARQVLLLVSGAHKASALRQLLEGGITTFFPASMLWMHPDATCLCDQAALG